MTAIKILFALFLILLLMGCGKPSSPPPPASLAEEIISADWEPRTESEAQELSLLCLVNADNPVPEDCSICLEYINESLAVDRRCIQELKAMLEACRAAGYEPYICSAYRDRETQISLYENKLAALMAQGLDKEAAQTEAARHVARPDTSEHQTGLAVDIIDSGYTVLDEAQAITGTQQWLMKNSWRYGFILRYPEDKSETTGIIYEPWHYRYVGRESAEGIYESGLCLEEWLEGRNEVN